MLHSFSKRLVASYIFDWVAIIAIAAIGAAFNAAGTNHRPFSLVDLSISYPLLSSVIPTWLLVVIGLVVPAIVVFIVCLLLVPGRAAHVNTPTKLIWRRKLWEWNTGWMGLGLSLALAFLFTQGMKNLFGKPRPDLLARCRPDVAHAAAHAVSNFGREFDAQWMLVSSTICQTTDKALLDDGFRSFPSGHSSFSWGGLFYLALFLCSKFGVTIPFLAYRSPADGSSTDDLIGLPLHRDGIQDQDQRIPFCNRAAAPPVYLLALPILPIGGAIYITASRYFQYHHHGFDVLSGSLIGILSSWFAFRWYHLPISRGAGWSWGARSRDRAWIIGVGRGGYVGPEGWESASTTGEQGTYSTTRVAHQSLDKGGRIQTPSHDAEHNIPGQLGESRVLEQGLEDRTPAAGASRAIP